MEEERKQTQEEVNTQSTEPEVESAAAKRLRALGISTEPEEPAEPIKKAGFIENFWYHYKWGFLATLFGIAVITVGVFQMVTKLDPDIYMMYAGPVYFDNAETSELTDAMEAVIPGDYNGDGKKQTSVMQAMYISESKAEEYMAEAADAGYSYSVNESFNASERERIINEFMSSTSIICLLDPEIYNEIKGDNIFMSLEEMFGNVPDAAIDKYGIKFSELEFKQYYSVFDILPEDTVLAVRKPTVVANYGDRDAEEVLYEHVRVVLEMLRFSAPEEE